ncbi:TetR family transcriptional regulator [Motilibacter rhizosphaerae]|uniref:TetR family transcriptional regulator n=1 Tax=Motilibacter rhizosphaerae TaxID=598652 RepID=A0A4Q7NT91_9ACTN|nr:TetR/AcrR family transcriptional regulator [Motilibacter rhizosphaerae]RZS90214.1 TetR family transcriptional regulator [Motilibacter rhizosphaerae]
MSAPVTARARVRAELTAAILDAARAQLASSGAAALSLRAVARDVGMVSSAVYRYFASRDELLTALIVETYDALGEAVEQADAAARERGSSPGERWLAAARAFRAWAGAHPHEFALVYGSPVPGYAAPRETVAPAVRSTLVLVRILGDAAASGALAELPSPLPVSLASEGMLAVAAPAVGEGVDPGELRAQWGDLPERSLVLMTSLVGACTAEQFGHLVGTVTDVDTWFDAAVRWVAATAGLVVPEQGG